jgi:oligopeptide transport system substrate-binding protein
VKPANFVGSGPFALKEWKPQDRIVVIKSEKHWDARNVKLKSLSYLPIDDGNVAYDKFKAGDIASAGFVPAMAGFQKVTPIYNTNSRHKLIAEFVQ